MYRRLVHWCFVLATVACSASTQSAVPAPSSPSAVTPAVPPSFSVLVFSRTEGFRHDSIPAGIAAIRQLGQQRGFSVDATEDAGTFADDALTKYKVVVFLSTTGDVLNTAQQAAFERYIR